MLRLAIGWPSGIRCPGLNRVDEINEILRSFQSGCPDVEASALISEDGLMIASALPQHVEESRAAGMSATMISLGTRAATELKRGSVEEIVVKGGLGYAVLIAVGLGTLLLALANKNGKLGLIFLDMRRSAEKLRRIL